ncbi:hypothetical protein [Micromonospora marina]|uniref:hypothetical protein n=1 Tax=Micromonospora marina TaxID=307120 RepID=UPI003D74085F
MANNSADSRDESRLKKFVIGTGTLSAAFFISLAADLTSLIQAPRHFLFVGIGVTGFLTLTLVLDAHKRDRHNAIKMAAMVLCSALFGMSCAAGVGILYYSNGKQSAPGSQVAPSSALTDSPGAALSGAPEPSPSSIPPTVPNQVKFNVRRSTGGDLLTLSESYSANLDSEQPDWGVSDSNPFGEQDLLFRAGGVGDILVESQSEMALMSQEPSYESCRATTGYGARIGLGEARAGLMLCVKTSERRLASVVVVKRSSQRLPNEKVQLRVTVWDPPLE